MASMIKEAANDSYVIIDTENWQHDTIQLLNTQSEIEDGTEITEQNKALIEETVKDELFEIEESIPLDSGQLIESVGKDVNFIDSTLNDEVQKDLVDSNCDVVKDGVETYLNIMDVVMNHINSTDNTKQNEAVHPHPDDPLDYEETTKIKFKEFLKTCPPTIEFCELIKRFIKTLPTTPPIYVLPHDKMPEVVSPTKKYAILCTAKDCENVYYRDGSNWDSIEQDKNFFGFPPEEERCKKWIKIIQRRKLLQRSLVEMQDYRICEDHFAPECFTNEFKEDLLNTAEPSPLLNGDRFQEISMDSDAQDSD